MFRMLFVVLLLGSGLCACTSEAHGPRGPIIRDLGYTQPGFYGFMPLRPARVPLGGPGYSNIGSSGFGYIYDPYVTGRFRMPDPMNDGMLREQYRYHTFFPGRRARRGRR